jgi:recombinational DNA repair protein (RecF pathway)
VEGVQEETEKKEENYRDRKPSRGGNVTALPTHIKTKNKCADFSATLSLFLYHVLSLLGFRFSFPSHDLCTYSQQQTLAIEVPSFVCAVGRASEGC